MKLRFTRRALRHLDAVRTYIGLQDLRAADRVIDRIGEAIEGLRLHPYRGRPGRIAGTRELVVAGTPYIVPYRVVGDAIEILAIIHGARLWPHSET